MRPKRINYELIHKLAGHGPYWTEKPTRVNMERLADPVVPLSERIRLLQNIIGGPLHYEEAAEVLGEQPRQVFATKLLMDEDPTANVIALFAPRFSKS